MKLLHQPNRWSCLPTSLAMVAGVDLDDVIAKIGHDGSDLIFPSLPEPVCRRSFMIEEIQYITPAYGFVLVPYVAGVIYKPTVDLERKVEFHEFSDKLKERNGLIFGYPMGKSLAHVVAWNAMENLIYDPNGTKYPAEAGNFVIETFCGVYGC